MDLVRDWNHARWLFFKISKISGGSSQPAPFSAAGWAVPGCCWQQKIPRRHPFYNTKGGQKVALFLFLRKFFFPLFTGAAPFITRRPCAVRVTPERRVAGWFIL
jgi:hypothetical protein